MYIAQPYIVYLLSSSLSLPASLSPFTKPMESQAQTPAPKGYKRGTSELLSSRLSHELILLCAETRRHVVTVMLLFGLEVTHLSFTNCVASWVLHYVGFALPKLLVTSAATLYVCIMHDHSYVVYLKSEHTSANLRRLSSPRARGLDTPIIWITGDDVFAVDKNLAF